jgi:hypothetical protein
MLRREDVERRGKNGKLRYTDVTDVARRAVFTGEQQDAHNGFLRRIESDNIAGIGCILNGIHTTIRDLEAIVGSASHNVKS